MPDTYTHGHHDSVLRSHRWRTAQNSAAYLLPSLRPGMDLLDVGCGPGTITLDLARLVAPGRVVGIDASYEVIEEAEAARREANVGNVIFTTADVYDIDLAPAGFDVVHAHQVLQHLSQPVRALSSMYKALRPGGILAVRDSDYGGFVWAPDDPGLRRWMDVYHQVCARNGAEADAGRYLLGWVRRAGFIEAQAGSSTWTYAEAHSREWWGGLWAERVEKSALADQAVDYGVCSREDLAEMAKAWRRWAKREDGFFAVLHGEVLARRPLNA